jgi:hypothetical protein
MPAIFGRDFEQASSGKMHVVRLKIFPPVDLGMEWSCRFTLRGGDFDQDQAAPGQDSLQAMLGAMQVAAIDLYTSAPWKSGQLTFLGMRDLGLPVPDGFTPRPWEASR